MNTFERILIKLIIIHFSFLLMTQLFFHRLNVFPELKVIHKYEGVVNETQVDIVETIWEDKEAAQ